MRGWMLERPENIRIRLVKTLSLPPKDSPYVGVGKAVQLNPIVNLFYSSQVYDLYS